MPKKRRQVKKKNKYGDSIKSKENGNMWGWYKKQGDKTGMTMCS